MKRTIVPFLTLTTLLFFASASYAQGGRPGGVPGSGGPGGMGATHGGAPNHGGPNAPGSMDAGKKTPDQLLSQNTKLSDNLGNLLTKMGVKATPQQACQNFKNLGQCVAAIHVANNLGLDFNSLACDMTLKPVGSGTCASTPSKAMSLGSSIEALKPGTGGKAEAQKAMKQADQDIKDSAS